MADPVTVICPADTWTLVGTDEVWGHLNKIGNKPNKYLYAYRDTGGLAPTVPTQGVPIFIESNRQLILSGVGIDIYIMAVGQDGEIRADYYF